MAPDAVEDSSQEAKSLSESRPPTVGRSPFNSDNMLSAFRTSQQQLQESMRMQLQRFEQHHELLEEILSQQRRALAVSSTGQHQPENDNASAPALQISLVKPGVLGPVGPTSKQGVRPAVNDTRDAEGIKTVQFSRRLTGEVPSASVPSGCSQPSSPLSKTFPNDTRRDLTMAEFSVMAQKQVGVAEWLNEQGGSIALALGVAGHVDRARTAMRPLTREHAMCAGLRRIVGSKRFSVLVVLLIVLNAIFTAVVCDHGVKTAFSEHEKISEGGSVGISSAKVVWHEIANTAFTAVFTVELLMRLFGLEFAFWIGTDWKWNLMDFALVVTSMMEIAMAASKINVNYVRLFRLLRILRSLRVIRVLRFFRELRLILLSVLNAIVPLMWSIAFISMVIFVFGVVAVQGVTEFLETAPRSDPSVDRMRLYFADLPVAIVTLFAAATGGINWFELSELLLRSSQLYRVLFLFYIVMMFLMILNIITGLFVNEAVERAQQDRDLMVQAEEQRILGAVAELKQLFVDLDVNNSGSITLQEFLEVTKNRTLKTAFATLGLDVLDAARLFSLLDVDGSQVLELDEFVVGCMAMKGNAKAVDVEMLMKENTRMMRKLQRSAHEAREHQRGFEKRVSRALESLEQNLGTGKTL